MNSDMTIQDFVESFFEKYKNNFTKDGFTKSSITKNEAISLKEDLKKFDDYGFMNHPELHALCIGMLAYINSTTAQRTKNNTFKGSPHILSKVYIKPFGDKVRIVKSLYDKTISDGDKENLRGKNNLSFNFLKFEAEINSDTEGCVNEADVFVAAENIYGTHKEGMLSALESYYGGFVDNLNKHVKSNEDFLIENKRKMGVSMFFASIYIRTNLLQKKEIYENGIDRVFAENLAIRGMKFYDKTWIVIHQPWVGLNEEEKNSLPFLFCPLVQLNIYDENPWVIPINRNTLLLMVDKTMNFNPLSLMNVENSYIEACNKPCCEHMCAEKTAECIVRQVMYVYKKQVLDSIHEKSTISDKSNILYYHGDDNPWTNFYVVKKINNEYSKCIFNPEKIYIEERVNNNIKYGSNFFYENLMIPEPSNLDQDEQLRKWIYIHRTLESDGNDDYISIKGSHNNAVIFRLNSKKPYHVYVTILDINSYKTIPTNETLIILSNIEGKKELKEEILLLIKKVENTQDLLSYERIRSCLPDMILDDGYDEIVDNIIALSEYNYQNRIIEISKNNYHNYIVDSSKKFFVRINLLLLEFVTDYLPESLFKKRVILHLEYPYLVEREAENSSNSESDDIVCDVVC